jgi:hypothetical protein
MKRIIAITLLLSNAALFTRAEQYAKADDFTNAFEIKIRQSGSNSVSKCQAVRLHKEWFLTAAHCFEGIVCASKCEIRARLIVGKNYEADVITEHSPDSKAYFKPKETKDVSGVMLYDLALVRFDPAKSKYEYSDPSYTRYFVALKEKEFISRLGNDAPLYEDAKQGRKIPYVLEIGRALSKAAPTPKILNRTIKVPSIWDGRRVALSSTDTVYYSPAARFLYTQNFGIRQGISGSGVMTDTGELVAIVSSVANIGFNNETVGSKYVFLATFDEYALAFLKEHLGKELKFIPKSEDPKYLKPVPQQYRYITDSFERAAAQYAR